MKKSIFALGLLSLMYVLSSCGNMLDSNNEPAAPANEGGEKVIIRKTGKFSGVQLDKKTMAYFDTIFQVPNSKIEAMKKDSVYVLRTKAEIEALWPTRVSEENPVPDFDFDNLCLVFASIVGSPTGLMEELKGVSLMRSQITDPWVLNVEIVRYTDLHTDSHSFYPHGVFVVSTDDVEKTQLSVSYDLQVRNPINESPIADQLIGIFHDDTVGVALEFKEDGTLLYYTEHMGGYKLQASLRYELADMTLTISSDEGAEAPFSYDVEVEPEMDLYDNMIGIHLDMFSADGQNYQALTMGKYSDNIRQYITFQ